MIWIRSTRHHSSGESLPITQATHSQSFVESPHSSSSYPSGRRQGWDRLPPMNNVLTFGREVIPARMHQRSFRTTAGALHERAGRLTDIYGA
jgi:hypothetical protein